MKPEQGFTPTSTGPRAHSPSSPPILLLTCALDHREHDTPPNSFTSSMPWRAGQRHTPSILIETSSSAPTAQATLCSGACSWGDPGESGRRPPGGAFDVSRLSSQVRRTGLGEPAVAVGLTPTRPPAHRLYLPGTAAAPAWLRVAGSDADSRFSPGLRREYPTTRF